MDAFKRFLGSCPPVGGTGKFVVLCNGAPYTSFDKESDAALARDMYAAPVKTSSGRASYNSQQSWTIAKR